MDSNNKNKNVAEDIRDLAETANEWMEEAQEAIILYYFYYNNSTFNL